MAGCDQWGMELICSCDLCYWSVCTLLGIVNSIKLEIELFMYVLCTCVFVCVHACMHVYQFVCVFVCLYVYGYVCECVYLCLSVCVYEYVHAQLHMWGGIGKGTYRGLTTKMRFMYKIVTICPMFNIIDTKLEKSLFISRYDPKY